MRVCSLYGAGFWFIPGTDTCIKLGGYFRVDTTFNGGIHGQPAWNADLGQQNGYRDYFASRSRMALTIDTRTATEYGVVRTFGQADVQFGTLAGSTFNPNSLATNLGNNPQLLDTPGGVFVATTDGVWLPIANGGTGEIKLTEAYGIRGAFNHNWNPLWSSSLFGSYSAVRYNGTVGDLTTARGQYCAVYTASTGAKSADYSCNPDFNVAQLGVVTRWTPFKNMTFSGEVQWFHLDQGFAGTATLAPTAPKPATVYEYKDQNAVSLQLCAQRNF